MRKVLHSGPSSLLADSFIFLLIAMAIYALTSFGQQWQASYNPLYKIDLSLSAVPLYALFSALRGFIAYLISLAFTLVVGYWAAKSARAEKVILPFLDIMQSIPVVGFLPGLVLGLVALFPHTNVGLELASILMIFTGQVWNMAFAFYSSLKSVPTDLKEAASVMKLSPFERLKLLELPYSAMNLTWNSVMSMAGGWFFLTLCEAFKLGDQPYRLPGLGAYVAVAIESEDTKAVIAGIFAMAAIILLFDMLLWRPALLWAHRFRLEDSQEQKVEEPLIQLLMRESFVVRLLRRFVYVRTRRRRADGSGPGLLDSLAESKVFTSTKPSPAMRFVAVFLGAVTVAFALYATMRLFGALASVPFVEWMEILRDTLFTFLRVIGSIVIGTLWTVPMAIWVVQSPARLRISQPIIQLAASFPAPMLYPLVLGVLIFLNIHFEISSMLLMLLGVQWYILFNVLAGALRVPNELRLCMDLMQSTKWERWRYLFLPSVLPALVTGWVTAAGGAWNASILAESYPYKGKILTAHGLGAQIAAATEHGDFTRLAACLSVMVVFVVAFNRTVWARLYRLAQVRYRMDL